MERFCQTLLQELLWNIPLGGWFLWAADYKGWFPSLLHYIYSCFDSTWEMIHDIEMLLIAGRHTVSLPLLGWSQPCLLSCCHPSISLFLHVLLPWQGSPCFSGWKTSLKRQRRGFSVLSVLYLPTFSLLWRGQRSGSMLGEVQRVCFLIEIGEGISLSYFQVVKLLFPIKIWGKNYSLKIPARWGFWCNLIQCSVYFLCGEIGSFFFPSHILCGASPKAPRTCKYGLLSLSCLRIWNTSSLSSSSYALLVPV